MTRSDLDEWLEREESEVLLRTTLKVLLVYVSFVQDHD